MERVRIVLDKKEFDIYEYDSTNIRIGFFGGFLDNECGSKIFKSSKGLIKDALS